MKRKSMSPKNTCFNIKRFNLQLLGACLALLLAAPNSYAQLYKWVDANGKVHYANHKQAVRNANFAELRTRSGTTVATPGTRPAWQQQEEESKKRREMEQARQAALPTVVRRPSVRYQGDKPETDSSRCRLARSIKSGAARHTNGAPTDANDLAIADSDVRTYCR
jgi:hypothetical protein